MKRILILLVLLLVGIAPAMAYDAEYTVGNSSSDMASFYNLTENNYAAGGTWDSGGYGYLYISDYDHQNLSGLTYFSWTSALWENVWVSNYSKDYYPTLSTACTIWGNANTSYVTQIATCTIAYQISYGADGITPDHISIMVDGITVDGAAWSAMTGAQTLRVRYVSADLNALDLGTNGHWYISSSLTDWAIDHPVYQAGDEYKFMVIGSLDFVPVILQQNYFYPGYYMVRTSDDFEQVIGADYGVGYTNITIERNDYRSLVQVYTDIGGTDYYYLNDTGFTDLTAKVWESPIYVAIQNPLNGIWYNRTITNEVSGDTIDLIFRAKDQSTNQILGGVQWAIYDESSMIWYNETMDADEFEKTITWPLDHCVNYTATKTGYSTSVYPDPDIQSDTCFIIDDSFSDPYNMWAYIFPEGGTTDNYVLVNIHPYWVAATGQIVDIAGASVTLSNSTWNSTLTSNYAGFAIFNVSSNDTYSFSITKFGFQGASGSTTVTVNDVKVDVVMFPTAYITPTPTLPVTTTTTMNATGIDWSKSANRERRQWEMAGKLYDVGPALIDLFILAIIMGTFGLIMAGATGGRRKK